MEPRELRGLEIAAKSRINRKGAAWTVPSQSNKGHRYSVRLDGTVPECTCLDHETRRVVCKHIHAVKYVIQREENEDGSTTISETLQVTEQVRTTYPQDWPAYMCEKWRAWVKTHIITGVGTNVVTGVEILGLCAADGGRLPGLVARTAENFQIAEVSADSNYSALGNLEAIKAVGAEPYVPFRRNAKPDRGGLWAKMLGFYEYRQDRFLEHYHKRSNVESTFNMIKAKFGDAVRSRTDTAMKDEVLCKILCHNIACVIQSMYEFGVEPLFLPEKHRC